MKCPLAMISVFCLVAVACDEETSTSPSQSTVLAAQLSAANEVPPATGPEVGATGSVMITFTKGATGYTAEFAVSVRGLPTTSVLVGAHIHEGGAGVAGPVRVNTGLSVPTAIVTPTGGAAVTFTGIQVTTELAEAIINNPPGWYFNVHSAINPAGVVRGQLARQ